ncbi:unnamed protein product, partial [Ilex paraguariensis]
EALSYGADALILWVSSVDYTSDVMAGPQVLRQMSGIYRMADYAVSYDDLPTIDQQMHC